MAKAKTTYECEHCGYVASAYLGRCPECQSWGSFLEHKTLKGSAASAVLDTSAPAKPLALSAIRGDSAERIATGYPELDRVLGGGLVPGSYLLIGGDPGIGKSTLMLQVTEKLSRQKPVLYVAGEESPYQIKLRASRLGVTSDQILIYASNHIQQVVEQIKTHQAAEPGLAAVVIDSIQSIYSPEASGTPGSVSQIKECAGTLMEVAKTLNVSIFLIGHVTKEGSISGPKLLEHTVDAVLYFEGDKYNNLRILRSVKNRFGNTQEIGVFEMGADGLTEVSNPSQLFLSLASQQHHPGSVIVPTIEGSRPILIELQALVGQSAYATPRRVANGIETNRLHQIVAVLERRLGLDFSKQDIYVNVVGGLNIDEPAADLGVAMAIVTSHRGVSVRAGTVFAGEIGLTGEIRPVRLPEPRLQEAERLGYRRIILPVTETRNGKPAAGKPQKGGIEVLEAQSLMDAIRYGLSAGGGLERPVEDIAAEVL